MIGETVNNYRVTELIGEGGMGAVYLAEHPFMGRKAAIKVLRREYAEDVGLIERFMNEARAANAIRHPNIIDIIDVGRMPSGIPYLMMEFLEGESLAGRVARGPVAVSETVDVILQTTAALAAAHGKGIVHRDLKPDNLYLVPDDSAPGGVRVKVLDFGIAKLRGDLTGASAKTQAGSVMGTPPYMSPEQCRGITDEVDHRTDIYAIGIILYEMLCGAPPFVSAGWGEVVLAHLTAAPESPRARNPSVPEWIEAVVMKALAKAPGDRFQSAAEMRAALRSMSPVATYPPRHAAGATLAAAATQPAPALANPATTFRGAAGQVASINRTLAEGPAARRGARRRSIVIGAGAAIVGVVVFAAVAASGGKRRVDNVVTAPRTAGAPAATVKSRPTAAPALAVAPTPTTAPPAPAPPPEAAPPAQRVQLERQKSKTATHASPSQAPVKKPIGGHPAPAAATLAAPPAPVSPAPARAMTPEAADKW